MQLLFRSVTPILLLTSIQLACGTANAPNITWQVEGPGSADYTLALDSVVKQSGRFSLHIQSRPVVAPGYLVLKQGIRADRYRGKRIQLTGYMKARELDADAQLWLRVEWPDAQWIAATDSRPLIWGTRDWTKVVVTIDVPVNAQAVWFGALLNGPGDLWLDSLDLEALPSSAASVRPASHSDEAASLPARPIALDFEGTGFTLPKLPNTPILPSGAPRLLSARGAANLAALAQLIADLRFFHADARTLTVRWDDIAQAGVTLVESAPTADSLARALQSLIQPFTTNVSVVPTAHEREALLRWRPLPDKGDGVLWWQHRGVGLGIPSVYSSLLHWTPGSVADSSRDVPSPRRPFRAQLPGGVTVLMPLSLYAPLPAVLSDTVRPISRVGATRPSSAADRTTRLSAVMLGWGVLQHFYPYFDLVKTNWSTQLTRALTRAAVDSGSAQFGVTVRRMIATLEDGHASVLGPGLDRPRTLPFQWEWVESQLVVTCVPDSSQTRLRRGDIISAVDGVPTAQALANAETLVSGATPQWRRLGAMRDLASGPRGSHVKLGIRHHGKALDVVQERLLSDRVCQPSLSSLTKLTNGVMYIDLRRATDSEITAAIPDLVAARGIIFDLRGYPRPADAPAILAHLTDSPLRSARLEIPVISRPDGSGLRFEDVSWEIPAASPRISARAVFITDGRAISYAETTLGIVEAFRLGTIVGETTAGTNGNVITFRIPGGYTLSFTGMRVRKHNGSTHHGVGIRPAVIVHQTLRAVREGRDDLLDAALKIAAQTPPPNKRLKLPARVEY
jgi:peptidase S41-like protein